MKSLNRLEYIISTKDGIAVVLLLGSFTKENEETIEKCWRELVSLFPNEAKGCILNFHDIIALGGDAIPLLIKLQENIREKFKELRLCSLKPSFKNLLLERGTVRAPELRDNLLESWRDLTFRRRT